MGAGALGQGVCLLLVYLAVAVYPQHTAAQSGLTKIAFGSCAKQDRPQPIWNAVLAEQPDVFVFLGDNIYGDTENPDILRAKYQQLGRIEGFQRLRSSVPLLATWDDHDYGQNDAGRENPIKHESRQVMLDFWGEPATSPRRTREGGIYSAHYLGEADNRVQIILLDLRWNRSPIKAVTPLQNLKRKLQKRGPYRPDTSEQAVFLGEAQWQWLQRELQQPARVRIIASSLQLLADFTGWEAWANYPRDLARLFEVIRAQQVEGLMVISGDTHWAEISRYDEGLPYPLIDITASGLTEEWHQISPNKNRISEAIAEANYGLMTIDWRADPVSIQLAIKNVEGKTLLSHDLTLDTLR
ncbi:alkaline phosphatase family protein [Exilibacterium tricleocarpae]|uniref:Alkaline phosphatase family protein n=2 Tax=Exilibacterium tricleocarpae TaxID=2591008 RepID=A0A545TP01_9GAMM|nr:alkaline phosphatase family protein [Exilibacterium tricleocarpae]